MFTKTGLPIVLLLFAAGCAVSHSYGTKLDPQSVAKIQKGRTTRKEVESLLGPPMNVAMVGDGRRIMIYNYMESEGRLNPQSFIPVVGLFAGSTTAGNRHQMLQIFLDTQSVVQDYELNDQTTVAEGSGIMGMSHSTVKQQSMDAQP